VPQATRRWISDKVKSLRESNVLPFHGVLSAKMVKEALEAEGVRFKDRIYTPMVTLCLFLSQVLDPDHSCRSVVAQLVVWLAVNGRKPCAPDTQSYCEARRRLPLGVIVRLVRQTAEEIEQGAAEPWLWHGRRVSIIDGSTASMPDTPANQKAFPQQPGQKPGLGFPLVRMVAIISLATGVARDLALGPYMGKNTGEPALLRSLLDRFESGEIALGDRCFGSYFGIAALGQRGVDGVFRMPAQRRFDFTTGRRLGREDHIVIWVKPPRPAWMDKATYAQMPDYLEVRELRVRVNKRGFRAKQLMIVTTLLDAEIYTKQEIARLYRDRWNIELDLRSIKDVLQMDVLRCKTPEMVEKEIWMHLLAYNLIRGVIAEAAEAHHKLPRRVSFKGAMQTMAAFGDALRYAPSSQWQRLWDEMLEAISRHKVGDRPDRVEPRANKRRPKNECFLTVPRPEARKRLMDAA
jgi:DDE family transposase